MMSRKLTTLLLLAALTLVVAGCSDDDPADPQVQVPAEKDFAGSDTCLKCHGEIYGKWVDSGHPYKVVKIDGAAPTDKFPAFSGYPNDPVDPPAPYTWADISYTIGGYGWKMRWIADDGYIITQLDDTQHNFEDESNVIYESGTTNGEKPYDCGRCHTTGWIDSDDEVAENNQDGMEGMTGTFFAGGVHCEECHGLGNQHAVIPADYPMTRDDSSAMCGRCHTRDAENHIASSSGFIKHPEQYDEWLHSPHGISADPDSPGCNDCHDPHSSVKFDVAADGAGTLMTCTQCHVDYAGDDLNHNSMPDCVTCHMPKATKSAIAVNTFVGDIRTHIFSINTEPVGKTEGMFNGAGTLVLEDEGGMAQVTLDFACYSCHKSEENGEGSAHYMTVQELSDKVLGVGDFAGQGGIHTPTKKVAANN